MSTDSRAPGRRRFAALERQLDRLVGSGVPLGGRHWTVCALVGPLVGILLAAALAGPAGLSRWTAGGVSFATAIACLALALVAKVVRGEESYTFYAYQLFALGVSAGLLSVLGQPVLAYLDLIALALGTALVFGRIGCLGAGCCHGRPHHWGLRYSEAHVYDGLPACYAGVRLFPVQAAAALWGVFLVASGALLVGNHRPPGEVLVWYVVGYAAGRFVLEFARGDAARTYWSALSEAQWISLVLIGGVGAALLVGALPLPAWYGAAVVGLGSALLVGLVAAGFVRGGQCSRLLRADHLREVVEAVDGMRRRLAIGRAPGRIPISRTSRGLRISGGRLGPHSPSEVHYTFSLESGVLEGWSARALATLISSLGNPTATTRLVRGGDGIIHVLEADPVSPAPGLRSPAGAPRQATVLLTAATEPPGCFAPRRQNPELPASVLLGGRTVASRASWRRWRISEEADGE